MLIADITLRSMDFDWFENCMRPLGASCWCGCKGKRATMLSVHWLLNWLPLGRSWCWNFLCRFRISVLRRRAGRYLNHLDWLAVDHDMRDVCVYLGRLRPKWIGTGAGSPLRSREILSICWKHDSRPTSRCGRCSSLFDIKIPWSKSKRGKTDQKMMCQELHLICNSLTSKEANRSPVEKNDGLLYQGGLCMD